LGKTQRGQINMQNLQQGIFENKQEGDNQNLFNNLSNGVKEIERQKQGQDKTKNNTSELHKQEQTTLVAISEGLSKNTERERNFKENGRKSFEENCKNNENASSQRIDWTKEEADKRRIDYYTKYGKEMCCLQCGKKLDHRPYNSIIEGWDKSPYKSPSTLSEMQFNEARQNNGRIFDISKVGIKGIDSLFGETIIDIKQPKDKGILLKHILESEVDEKYFLSVKMIAGFERHKERHNEKGTGFGYVPKNEDDKGNSLRANAALAPTDNMLIVHNTMPRSSTTGKGGTGPLSRADGKTYCLDTGNTNDVEIKAIMLGRSASWGMPENGGGKSYTLCKEQPHGIKSNSRIRRLTPLECERLQTVPDNYTNHVSDSQRYKMLGNGWTVDVIAHIFKYL
jgi:site-specific DNA-cytosine methylase